MNDDRQVIIVREKSGSIFWKFIGIFALICAIPFLCMLILPVGILGAIATFVGGIVLVENYGTWVLAALLGAIIAVPITLAISSRLSNRRAVQMLKSRVLDLEGQLMDARHQVLILEEEQEFHKKLESSKVKPVNTETKVDS